MAATNAGNVTAMHDATEGGITGAFIEMADGASERFDVDSEAMPVAEGVGALCDALDIDPWHVSSCGTLLAAVNPADADSVVDALRDRGTPAAVVGEVTNGSGSTSTAPDNRTPVRTRRGRPLDAAGGCRGRHRPAVRHGDSPDAN